MMFRKKPVIIEAIQFKSKMPFSELESFLTCDIDWTDINGFVCDLSISTLEGDLHVSPGDWIIRGIKGEFYPCKPDIFEATYDPVMDV